MSLISDERLVVAAVKGDNHAIEELKERLQPFLNPDLIPLPHLIKTPCEPRTSDDHQKIWQLLELAVLQQLKYEDIDTSN